MRKSYFSYIIIALLFTAACSEDEPVPESGVSVTPFEGNIDENPQAGDIIGVVEVIGAEGNLQFSLNTGEPAGALAIDSQSGELSVADPALFDHEVNPVITAQVAVEAENGSASGSITIIVNNVNESGNFTIWTGAQITFVKTNGSDPSLETNQDRLSDDVWITRANDGGQIYNAKTESTANKSTSPAGTKWAVGQVANIESLTFSDFRTAVGDPKSVVGKDLVLYLEAEDAYVAVNFSSWTVGKTNGGGFTYTRNTK